VLQHHWSSIVTKMELLPNQRPRSHQKSKHVLLRYHLIREIIERGDVKVCKVDTDANMVDPLTKPLSQARAGQITRNSQLAHNSLGL
jgi:hypothetical protein